MPSNFLTKLVKASPSSNGRSRQPSPNRSQGHTPTSSVDAGGRSISRIVVDPSSEDEDNPQVTVIPPSPRSDRQTTSDLQLPSNGSQADQAKPPARSPRTPSYQDELPTPTPDKPQPHLEAYTAQHPQIQRSSSASNLRSFFGGGSRSRRNSVADEPSDTILVPNGMARSGSTKSTASHAANSSSRHGRASTDSAVSPRRSIGSLSASDREDASGSHSGVMSPIVESPTAIRQEFFGPEAGIGPSMSNHSTLSSHGSSSGFLSAGPKDADAVSIISATTGKKSRPWRRSATTSGASPPRSGKKPTGLASAIAASGLAMVNPASTAVPSMPGMTLPMQTSPPALPKRTRVGSAPGLPNGTASRSRQTSISMSEPRSEEGVEVKDSDSESGSELSDDELDLDPDDIPVTGFAVASSKRNADFHELFPGIPEGDYLIEDYGCALQREILIQGRMYISENHICFHANIFGWITDLLIPMYEVTQLEKKMTAFVIPNAIQISTPSQKYNFASFLSRDTTFDVLYNVWRLARPDESSFGGSGRPSLEESIIGAAAPAQGASVGARKATRCACGRDGKHYSETAMEAILPGTPEKIYNLLFASGFIKEFMMNEQMLMDLQISDWTPLPNNPKLLARNMSYIKPLNGSIGPKQTRCELRDENEHIDFDDYISTITTTRTPEVPSGTVFSVKTRTCIMWASAVSSKIVVTSQVEWTGRSFIKGIIERSCIDGQKTYHADLEKAVRRYIAEHQSEFIPEGVDAAAVVASEAEARAEEIESQRSLSAADVRKERDHERGQRSLQWAYDTFEGAMKVAKQSTEGALEILKDAWDNASGTTLLYIIIVALVISNVWTLTIVGKREDVGRRKERSKVEEREKWIHGVVTALWEELQSSPNAASPQAARAPGDWRDELADIHTTLDLVELRVKHLRESLNDLN